MGLPNEGKIERVSDPPEVSDHIPVVRGEDEELSVMELFEELDPGSADEGLLEELLILAVGFTDEDKAGQGLVLWREAFGEGGGGHAFSGKVLFIYDANSFGY